jgi:hypothetical protein
VAINTKNQSIELKINTSLIDEEHIQGKMDVQFVCFWLVNF